MYALANNVDTSVARVARNREKMGTGKHSQARAFRDNGKPENPYKTYLCE